MPGGLQAANRTGALLLLHLELSEPVHSRDCTFRRFWGFPSPD